MLDAGQGGQSLGKLASQGLGCFEPPVCGVKLAAYCISKLSTQCEQSTALSNADSQTSKPGVCVQHFHPTAAITVDVVAKHGRPAAVALASVCRPAGKGTAGWVQHLAHVQQCPVLCDEAAGLALNLKQVP